MCRKRENPLRSIIRRRYAGKIPVTQGLNIANDFPAHFHSTYTLGLIENGERCFLYRGIRFLLRPGDLYIVQRFESHACRAINFSAHSYKVISLDLDPTWYFPALIIDDTALKTMVKEFHLIAESGKPTKRISLLHDKIVSALAEYSLTEQAINSGENASKYSRIKIAKTFIDSNCLIKIDLQEMADRACLSEFHFNRVFSEYFGISPYAYYLLRKIKESQSVLLRKNSATETAYECGFFDQSHFTKEFKKHVGVTPGAFLHDNRQ
jgi:AraC-like DNA-binding protein